MLKLTTDLDFKEGHADVCFASSDTWRALPVYGDPSAINPLSAMAIHFGEEAVGPLMLLHSLRADTYLPDTPAHFHDSDSWRMSLRGTFPMGRQIYGPGAFRFNEGLKGYPSDNVSAGPEGGWQMLVFADWHGLPKRLKNKTPQIKAREDLLGQWVGLRSDEKDAPVTCSDPCLVTTVSKVHNRGHINGSFSDSVLWRQDDSGRAVMSAAVGSADRGPLILFAKSSPGAAGISVPALETELVRAVVDGSCTIGGTSYKQGDLRIQAAGSPDAQTSVGPQGLSEVLIFGSRGPVFSTLGTDRWSGLVHDELKVLEGKLRERGGAIRQKLLLARVDLLAAGG